MIFATPVGNFVAVRWLVKKALTNIKSAPKDFREVEKTVQGLNILLESIQTEVESPTSVFKRELAQAEQFGLLVICTKVL